MLLSRSIPTDLEGVDHDITTHIIDGGIGVQNLACLANPPSHVYLINTVKYLELDAI